MRMDWSSCTRSTGRPCQADCRQCHGSNNEARQSHFDKVFSLILRIQSNQRVYYNDYCVKTVLRVQNHNDNAAFFAESDDVVMMMSWKLLSDGAAASL